MKARKKRIEELDMLRGFALFGVLLVNLTMMHASRAGFPVSRMGLEGLDSLSAWIIEVFFQGKFYTIFSTLFGLGFYLFMNRKKTGDEEHALDMKPFFLRRMIVLLIFGILHMVFVWHGDILHTYAVIGFILLWKRSKTDEGILRGAMLWLGIAVFLNGLLTALSEVPSLYHAMMSSELIPYADRIYSQGSYIELLRFRLVYEVQNAPANLIFILPKILGLFYLGFYLGRKQLFQQLKDYRGVLVRVLRYSTLISLGMILGLEFFRPFTGGEDPYYTFAFLEGVFEEILTLSGSAFYSSGLLLLLQNLRWKKVLNPLKYMGKMALTNYLVQTVVWTFIFNGYGLGYYGEVPYRAFIPLAVIFFLLQALFSKLWLSRWKMGPMEALWRKLTYNRG